MVNFKHEAGIDHGGLYNEFVTIVSNDLQSQDDGLFILTPNSKQNEDESEFKYVPNPSKDGLSDLHKYYFVGKLLVVCD